MNALARNPSEPLPDAVEAEQALLGAILNDNTCYWRVAGFLKPQHFCEPVHAMLYEHMAAMIAEQRPVTPITIKPYIPADATVEGKTLYLYVIEMMREAIGSANAYEYGRGVIEVWGRRQIILAAQDAVELAHRPPRSMTPDKMISELASRLTKIASEGNERAASLRYGVILPAAINKASISASETTTLIPWFLPEVTAIAGNVRRGNLIGFMSDSGGGKTSFALSQCRHAAVHGFKSAFFSIEITAEEAALQAAAQASRVPLSRLDMFTLQEREMDRIAGELAHSTTLPFDIMEFADCQLSDIAIKLEALVKNHGLDFVAIDHAKLIQLPGKSNELFAQRIFALYGGLKALAKKLNVAIMLLIQRNSDWKRRWEKGGNTRSLRPVKGDAYGGDGVEQNLDVWFSLYRPEPLLKSLVPAERSDAKREKLQGELDQSVNRAWLINHKRRRGEPQGSQEILFEPEWTLFRSPQADMPPAFEGLEGFA